MRFNVGDCKNMVDKKEENEFGKTKRMRINSTKHIYNQGRLNKA